MKSELEPQDGKSGSWEPEVAGRGFQDGAPREHLLMAASLTVSLLGISLFAPQKNLVQGIEFDCPTTFFSGSRDR